MTPEAAEAIALQGAAFVFAEDTLRDRFLALSGVEAAQIRGRIEDADFLMSLLEFLIAHEPDLLAFAENANQKPDRIVSAWRTLGGVPEW